MSRIEYRVQYQIFKGEVPVGRVWRRICHTRQQALDFIRYLDDDAERQHRGIGILSVDYRSVGRWVTWDGPLNTLPTRISESSK